MTGQSHDPREIKKLVRVHTEIIFYIIVYVDVAINYCNYINYYKLLLLQITN